MLLAIAVRGFDSPDADEDGRVDAELFPDGAQSGRPLRRFAQPDGDPAWRDQACEIGAEWLAVFRLPPPRGDDAGVGRKPGKSGVECRAGDAFLRGVGPKRCEERGEAVAGLGFGGYAR